MSTDVFHARVTAVVIGSADLDAARAMFAAQTIAQADLEIKTVPAGDWTALDTALIEADAPLIALLPAKAALHPDKLRRQIEQLDSDPDLALSIHPLDAPAGAHRIAHWRLYNPELAALLAPPCEPGGATLRVAAFDAAFGFRKVDDPLWDWTARVVLSGGRVGVIEEALAGRAAGAAAPPLPPLFPSGPRNGFILEQLRGLSPSEFLPQVPREVDVLNVLAGLYQWHDALEESHGFAQRADDLGPNPTASYWHGIVHRREGDFDNACYWFRKVGPHSVFPQLEAASTELRRALGWTGGWDPFRFIDLCRRCASEPDSELQTKARELQGIELCLLFRHTYDRAVGRNEN